MQDRLAARRGVLPIEVPRPGVLWHGRLKIGHALVQHFHFALGGWWGQQGGNAFRNGGIVKGVVDLADVVHRGMRVAGQLFAAGRLDFFQQLGFPVFFEERNGGPEGHKSAELAHVDAVAVGVADLGGARHEENSGRFQSVQNGHDGFPQGGATNDGVIEHDERGSRGDQITGDVVHVQHQVAAGGIAGDEGAHALVFVGQTFHADGGLHEGVQLFAFGFTAADVVPELIGVLLSDQLGGGSGQPFGRRLGGIGNKREYRVVHVAPQTL